MIKKINLLFLFCLCSIYSFGQNTVVTATITDGDGFVWSNAQWSVAFVPNQIYPNTNSYTINGQPITTACQLSQKGLTNSLGTFSVTVCDNTQILPAGSSWQFTIKSNTSAQATVYSPIQLYGSSYNLTSFLSTNAVLPRFPAILGAYAYGDVELTTVPLPGGSYFNTTTITPRYWNGTIWTNYGAGGGVTAINSYPGSFTFTGAVTCVTTTCNFTGGGGSVTFNLNAAEEGAYTTGLTLTHTGHYSVPLNTTTSGINALIAANPQSTLEFQAGDVANSFTNNIYLQCPNCNQTFGSSIQHDQIWFFHKDLNWDQNGVVCDARQIYVQTTSGSHTITSVNSTMTNADIGKVIWIAGSVSGTPTAFETQVQTVNNPTFTVATPAPFTITTSGGQPAYIGTDNTTAEQAAITLSAYNSDNYNAPAQLTMSAGGCMAHTLTPPNVNAIGAGVLTNIIGAPGEDIFAAPDPSVASWNGGSDNHVADFSITLDESIDATNNWQIINDAGITSKTPNNRPAYKWSVESNYPLGPGWIKGSGPNYSGAINGVATTNGTTLICIPTGGSPQGLPAVGQQIMFPYQTTLIETTVSTLTGSCTGGSAGYTPLTLGASIPAGTQQEWFAGNSIQTTAIDFPASPTYPFTLSLTNSIQPSPASEYNVAPYGLIKIGSQQCTYTGYHRLSGLNNITISACTGTSVDHPANTFIAPLNPITPANPFPVTPTINTGTATPVNAAYFPGHNIGNCGFAFPQLNGTSGYNPAWSHGKVENIFINSVNNITSNVMNNSCGFYFVGLPYGTEFDHINIVGPNYGIIQAGPSTNNHNFYNLFVTDDGMSWNNVEISGGYIFDFIAANQVQWNNFNTYSSLNGNGGVGAFFVTQDKDEQTGVTKQFVGESVFTNMYDENNFGSLFETEPMLELDSHHTVWINMHMNSGGGEIYTAGYGNKWISGEFNSIQNIPSTTINYGDGNVFEDVALLGNDPVGNAYGVNQFLNWGPRTYMRTRLAGITGPYGNLSYGNNRSVWEGQTNETFNTGNLTVPYPYSASGFITPDEYAAGNYDVYPMTQLWTFDATAQITQANAACAVGTTITTVYCAPTRFNDTYIYIGPGQRLVPGKYMLYGSFKSGLTSNTFNFGVGAICGGSPQTILASTAIPVTNAYPTTAAGTFQQYVDLTNYSNCQLVLNYYGATSADTIYNQFIDFAPLPENFNVQALTVRGSGFPTYNNGIYGIETWQSGAPSTGCGTTYPNGSIWHNLAGTASSANRFWVCDSATTTWNAKF